MIEKGERVRRLDDGFMCCEGIPYLEVVHWKRGDPWDLPACDPGSEVVSLVASS